jgi:hypothetical protein
MMPVIATVIAVLAEIEAGDGLSLTAAARMFPGCRGAAAVNPATIFRWATKGVRLPSGTRLKLEAVRVGNRWLTSRAAVRRMITALTTAADPAPAAPVRSLTDRQKASARAAEMLERMGA